MINQLPSEFRALSLDRKFYAVGGALMAIYVASLVLLNMFSDDVHAQSRVDMVMPLIIGFLTTALVLELAQKISSLWTNLWFGFLVAFFTFIAYSMARVEANGFLNELVAIDPGKLSEAQTLLTSLLLVPSWIKVLLFVLALLLSVATLVVFFQMAMDKKSSDIFLGFARLMGALGLYMGLAWVDKLYEHPLVKDVLKNAVVVAEYHPKTICTNVFPGERVADVGGGFVSVFSTATGTFEPRPCEQPRESGS